MPPETTLLAPNARRYVLEPGVIDDRSMLAFTNGHCHSLALAIHERTGWETVGLYSGSGSLEHVLAADPAGRFVDIGGVRRQPELVSDGRMLAPLDPSEISALPDVLGWAIPQPAIASEWVSSVLERVASGVAPERIGYFEETFRFLENFEVLVEWTESEGALYLRAFLRIRGSISSDWRRCASIPVAKNEQQERLIDFSREAFEAHLQMVQRGFNSRPELVFRNVEENLYSELPRSSEIPFACPAPQDGR